MTHFAQGGFRRRALLKAGGLGLAGIFAAPALAACGSSKGSTRLTDTKVDGDIGGTLNLLTWEGYADPSFVSEFESRTGVKVNASYVGSNDEMITKLRSAKGTYDLASPSCDSTGALIDAGLVRPIDQNRVPQLGNAFPKFRTAENVVIDGLTYGTPMMFGFIALLVNADVLKDPAPNWSLLWDEKYAKRSTVWNDISSIWNTSFHLGQENVFSLSEAELAAVKTELLAQRPLLKKYWSSAGELTELFTNREVDVASCWGGFHAAQLKARGLNVQEILPQEGFTGYWDTWMIPATSTNPATAMAWMDYVLEADVQKKIADVTGYGVTSQAAISNMSKEYVEGYRLEDPSFFDRASWWERVPNRQAYLDVLNEVQGA
ncbi:PotD/PotF family extracellular solute-binding protein [Pseudarthrobacter sp. NKDBFgelt]